MTTSTQLRFESHKSVVRAEVFFFDQLAPSRPAWGAEPGTDPDPWTTGQLCFLLAHSKHPELLRRPLVWLSDAQNANGSWGSTAYGPHGDTPATACAALALLRHVGNRGLAAQRGLEWLCTHYKKGWTTIPDDPKDQFLELHHYSTAYAIRALARARRLPTYSLCIQEGLTSLIRVQVEGKGWGFQRDSPSDPTFTCYVLHGLLDASRILTLPVYEANVAVALNWLLSQQNKDGYWSDWHGIRASPEATGYALYTLLSAGYNPDSVLISKAVRWLLDVQHVDGAWSLSGEFGDDPNNWVTQSAVSGLRAYTIVREAFSTLAASETHGAKGLFVASGIQLVDVDQEGDKPDNDTHSDTDIPTEVIDVSSGAWTEADTLKLYQISLETTLRDVPHTRPLDHTMFEALDGYVLQKLPVEALATALRSGVEINVLGVDPQHLPLVSAQLGIRNLEDIQFRHKITDGHFNEQRPRFFNAERSTGAKILVVSVMPGHDYVMHYASLVRHFAMMHTKLADRLVRVLRYPLAEHSLARWTRLEPTLVQPGDRVLLGYVLRVKQLLDSRSEFVEISEHDNPWYGSYRYRLPNGDIVALLGVKYCFWGSTSEILVHGLCELGVSEIIYAAKLGALSSPRDLYERIFCPSKYAILNHDRVVYRPKSPVNGVLAMMPSLDSGYHVSVPTVLEEDYSQRNLTIELRATSIDNEIAQMARGISAFNETTAKSVRFSAVHFATDYVRTPNDRAIRTAHDLERNRSPEAKAAKAAILNRITTDVLIPYWLSPRPIVEGTHMNSGQSSEADEFYASIRAGDQKLQAIEDKARRIVFDLCGYKATDVGSFGLLVNLPSSDLDLAIGVLPSDVPGVLDVLRPQMTYKGERQSTENSTRHVFTFIVDGTEVDVGVLPQVDFDLLNVGLDQCRREMTEAERVEHVWEKNRLKQSGMREEYAQLKLAPYAKYCPSFLWRPIL